MEHHSCSSVEAGRDASPAICWLGEKRAEGNPLHAFTSPDGVAVVLAPTESAVTRERFSLGCNALLASFLSGP